MKVLDLHSADGKKLAKIREQLAALQRERAALSQARLSDDEIRARVASDLDQFVRFGGESLGALAFEHEPGPDLIGQALSDPRALASLLRNQLDQAIADRVIAEAGPVDAVAASDRQKRVAELDRREAKLETDEERETLRLEGAGFTVARRADVDVDLIFSLWTESAETAA